MSKRKYKKILSKMLSSIPCNNGVSFMANPFLFPKVKRYKGIKIHHTENVIKRKNIYLGVFFYEEQKNI